MSRRLMAILAAAIMLLISVIATMAVGEGASPTEGTEYPEELRVGHTTALKGDFFTEMFGNDTADIDVRALLHGYNLVNWDQNQGVYLIDESVVENWMVVGDEDGNKTYFIGLYDDLYYSDGTPVTAWDYAFSLLLMMSPEIEQIGGKIYRAEHILGYNEYITGELPYLTGVGVIDDHQLAITLDHEFLPYFFETGLLLCVPYPVHEIAPGCRVYAGGAADLGGGYGYGIYIGNEDITVAEPVYTAELLARTILDPETGYNSHPRVVSGPYRLVSFDGETAEFEINEYFKGAWVNSVLPERFQSVGENLGEAEQAEEEDSQAGPGYLQMSRYSTAGEQYEITLVKPVIERISFGLADNNTVAEDLRSGTFHLVNKMTYGPVILELMGVQTQDNSEMDEEEQEEITEDTSPTEAEEAAEIRYQNYPRIGLSFLTFTYERSTVHEMEVRQAIAWCMDRDGITQDYTSGLGMVVDGYYGIEQWEYLICHGQLDYPIKLVEGKHTEAELSEWAQHSNMYATSEEEWEQAENAWEMLSLDRLIHYEVNLDRARTLLESAEWTLNREGEAYRPGVDDVRCKRVDGELVALDLTMMYPEGNHIMDTIQERFLDNLAEVGIRVTLVPEKMEALLRSYYRETERSTDMIYLATNFHVMVDPAITYSTDSSANHQIWNNTYSDDEELYARAVDMRKTEPQDIYDYVVRWISFQERYNEVLPTIPIYSNLYFDFYNSQLQNYYVTSHVTWSQAILEAYFGEDLDYNPWADEPEGVEDAEDLEEFDDF